MEEIKYNRENTLFRYLRRSTEPLYRCQNACYSCYIIQSPGKRPSESCWRKLYLFLDKHSFYFQCDNEGGLGVRRLEIPLFSFSPSIILFFPLVLYKPRKI